jgi:hypothetical protein
MPFASVVLFDQIGKKAGFAVTDMRGRYFLLIPKGSYQLVATTSSAVPTPRQFTLNVATDDGWISSDLKV